MNMNDLIGKLKERPKTEDAYQEEQKTEWISALNTLFTEIERWLAPAEKDGVLRTVRSESEKVEHDIGNYRAPMLEIHSGGFTVRLDPVGVRVVGLVGSGGRRLTGLRGRVDIICGPIRIPLVRKALGDWQALPLRGEPRDLTEESFAELLAEVLLDE